MTVTIVAFVAIFAYANCVIDVYKRDYLRCMMQYVIHASEKNQHYTVRTALDSVVDEHEIPA